VTRRALVLSGGPHPFAETTPVLEELLVDLLDEVVVVDEPGAAASLLVSDPPELWVANTLRWRMAQPRYEELRRQHAYETEPAVAAAFDEWVRGGGSLLALHAAPICFDDWEGWGRLVGARWEWGRSSHPPIGEMTVEIVGEHPLTAGIADFTVHDEAYGDMWLAPDVEPLAVSRWGGRAHPVLWVRDVGEGTVVTSTLGHGTESLNHPVHRELLRRSISLLVGSREGELR
jgi:hypothetical protein